MKKALPALLIMFVLFLSVIGFITYYIQKSLAPIDQKAAQLDVYDWKNAGVNTINHPKTCNYFVALNGNNTNNGTSLNTPWKDINYAVTTAPAGSTICLRGGEYNFAYKAGFSLTKGNQRLTNYQNEVPILLGPGVSKNFPPEANTLISILSSGNIVENLTIENIPTRVFYINSKNRSADNNIIRNNRISGVGYGQIQIDQFEHSLKNTKVLDNILEYCNTNKVTKVEIYPGGGTPGGRDCAIVQIKGTRNSTTNNTATLVEGNVVAYTTDHGFMIDPNFGRATGVIIRNNYLLNTGAYLHGGIRDFIIDSNVFIKSIDFDRGGGGCIGYNSFEDDIVNNQGISDEDADSINIRITNNILYGCDSTLRITAPHSYGQIKDLLVKGNTLVSNGSYVFRMVFGNITHGSVVDFNKVFENSKIEDNIFYGFEGVDMLRVIGGSETVLPKGLTVKNNIWSVSPGGSYDTDNIISDPNLVGKSNIQSFKSYTPSTNVNSFLEMFKLTSSSPAINKSLDTTLTKDVFGNTRPVGAKNDIGAIEFGGVAQTGTPVPSTIPTAGPSLTPTSTKAPSPTPLSGNVCGKADVNNDGIFTLVDFAEFAKSYGNGTKTCADKNVDYGACRGRDANKDGRLNIVDFGGETVGFAQRYFPKTSCALD